MASKSLGARVLVIDDDQQERLALLGMISAMGYATESASDGAEALEKLRANPVDVIVTDLIMPRVDGFELLKALMERGDLTPAIVLTGFGSIDQAVSVVHDLRAFWFLEKPAQQPVLETLLERAVQHRNLIKETERLQRQLSYQGFMGDLVGKSDPMRQIFSLIQQVAPSSASVLITGESGTGKEMVAAAIHKLSPRAGRPFVAVNCAALPENLIESELFGHEKGSFTGALGRHTGCFEQAHQGTLLLDEIGEMPLAMQAKLLRVLEESKVRRLGGSAEVPVDVRVLAATNRPVQESLDGKFLREDLYYRINVFHIDLPPLRHRKEDIPELSEAILAVLNRKYELRVAEVHPATIERLKSYSWPGNIRELRNILERSVIMAREGVLLPSHLPSTFGQAPAQSPPNPQEHQEPTRSPSGVGRTLNEVEKVHILSTLKSANNNKTRAAQILGISLRTLHSRLSAFASEDTGTASSESSATGSA